LALIATLPPETWACELEIENAPLTDKEPLLTLSCELLASHVEVPAAKIALPPETEIDDELAPTCAWFCTWKSPDPETEIDDEPWSETEVEPCA